MALELSVDGHSIFAATGGADFDPALPTIIFIHGASMDRSVWAVQARYFAHRGYGVLAVDLPGHGKSKGALLPSIGDIADWVMRLMDAAGVKTAVLAGHSMGSLPVLEAAARYPERVERAIMLGISVPMMVADALLDNAEANNSAAHDMVNIWGHSMTAQIGGNTAPGIWRTGGGLRLLERGGDGVLHNDMKACNDYTTGLEAAAKVACPATLILGDGDMMTPPKRARDLMAALPDARMIVLKGCGHMMMSEQPNETLDAMIAALK